ncbi:MAG: phosphomannomutase/phosphoglucomutase [Vampirovibrionales bacterium]|nr:phosphomannomutase/phosphoglucomutase [Vampirovibrionales bacterium]
MSDASQARTAAAENAAHLAATTAMFCTYDIRAVVNETTFNRNTLKRLGLAFANWLKAQPETTPLERPLRVAIGYDARLQSPEFYEAFIQGLNCSGISAVKLGLVPTTLVYFAEVATTDADLKAQLLKASIETPDAVDASVTVTASHNPKEYNGLKFTFKGNSLSAAQILEIKHAYLETPLPQATAGTSLESEFTQYSQFSQNSAETSDSVSNLDWDPRKAYTAWASHVFTTEPSALTLIVDSGNGAAGVIAPELFKAMGYNVVSLYETPDGNFPNHHPDPCAAENLKDLQAAVIKHQADLGIAFDGDGDRMGIVDNAGEIIPGDRLMMLLAQEILARPEVQQLAEKPAIVSEVKCSQHLFNAIDAMGGRAIMSPTGHAIMKHSMLDADAILGGELSGHIFYRLGHWGFDDGMYAALCLLRLLKDQKQQNPEMSVHRLLQAFPASALSQEHRVKLEKAKHAQAVNALKAIAQTAYDAQELCGGLLVLSLNTVDGIRANLAGGFWLVRASNTEPCLTLRCEAPDASSLKQLESWMLQTVHDLIRTL